MKNKIESAIVLSIAIGVPAIATAGPKTPIAEVPASNSGDWCEWLQSKPGTLYKNKENPYIQKFQIEGRFQYQYGHVDGNDLNGVDYDEDYDEARRVRLGVKAKFLHILAQVSGQHGPRHTSQPTQWRARLGLL